MAKCYAGLVVLALGMARRKVPSLRWQEPWRLGFERHGLLLT